MTFPVVAIDTPWGRRRSRRIFPSWEYPNRTLEWREQLAKRYERWATRWLNRLVQGEKLCYYTSEIDGISIGKLVSGDYIVMARFRNSARTEARTWLWRGPDRALLHAKASLWLDAAGQRWRQRRAPRTAERVIDYYEGKRLPTGITVYPRKIDERVVVTLCRHGVRITCRYVQPHEVWETVRWFNQLNEREIKDRKMSAK